MNIDARRQFWSKTPQRPALPWLHSLAQLHELCTRCGDCLAACPEHIVIKGDGGFPCLDFEQGECSFCGKCVDSCAVSALFDRTKPAFEHRAQIGDDCLPKHGIACQSCADVCEASAIQFQWNTFRQREPQLLNDLCNGCGACYRVCAPHAIHFSQESTQ